MFTRIFLSSTGAITVLSGTYLIVVTILAITNHPRPGRIYNVIFTFVFLAAFVCHGAAWLMLALSKRLWK